MLQSIYCNISIMCLYNRVRAYTCASFSFYFDDRIERNKRISKKENA